MRDAAPLTPPAKPAKAHVLPELPPLAWLAEVGPGGVSLLCGRDVETFPEGCFEGCWAGRFADRGFDASTHVFGSGLKTIPGGALVGRPLRPRARRHRHGLELARLPGQARRPRAALRLRHRPAHDLDPEGRK